MFGALNSVLLALFAVSALALPEPGDYNPKTTCTTRYETVPYFTWSLSTCYETKTYYVPTTVHTSKPYTVTKTKEKEYTTYEVKKTRSYVTKKVTETKPVVITTYKTVVFTKTYPTWVYTTCPVTKETHYLVTKTFYKPYDYATSTPTAKVKTEVKKVEVKTSKVETEVKCKTKDAYGHY